LVVVENASHRRAILQDHGVRGIGSGRGQSRRLRDRGCGGFGIIRCLGTLLLEHGLFDRPQAAHLLPHLNLGVTVGLEDRLGQIAEEVVRAVTMRHVREFRRDPRHERVLPVGQPKSDGLAQRVGPLFGLLDQASHLLGRCRDQRFREPHALLSQLPYGVEGLVSLLRLQAVDRKDDLVDRFILPPQELGVLLTRTEHRLVAAGVIADALVGELDSVRVEQFGLDLWNRPVSRKPSMPNPAKDVPADRPMRWGDGRFRFGALGLGVPGTTGIGAMVEFADQFHRAVERVDVAIPVVADVHHMPTEGAVAIEDVKFPRREVGIRRPMVRHRADIHALVISLNRGTRTRGYVENPAISSHLLAH
jgi:hypothetical protein